MKLNACILAVALAASPAFAQAPDAAHLALARQVTALLFGSANFEAATIGVAEISTKVVSAQVVFDEAAAQPESDTAPPPPTPKFNAAALHKSFALGIAQITPGYQDAVAAAYAAALTDDQMHAMLTFFSSPAGRAALASRKAFVDRQAAAAARQDPFEPPKKGGGSTYVEARAEQAFDASPAGLAVKRDQAAMGARVLQSLKSLWPQAMQTAEADYCGHEPCGDPERKVFAGLQKVWDQAASPTGH